MTFKGTVWLMLSLLAGSSGSTCHGQSSGGEVQKDPGQQTQDVTLQGVDTSALTPREKKEWSSYVGEFLAPCSDVPVSIAQCVLEKRSCARCLPAAKYVLKGVRDGLSREQIEKSYKNRFDSSKIRDVPIEGSPQLGSDSAPITIVEFADFECPFCAMMAPILDKAWQDRKQQVRFVYKFFPLSGHPHGEPAARAAIAAANQGKFWEMHHKLFQNREHLEPSDIDSYAKEVGLNLSKFHDDMQAQLATDRIAKDRKLADSLDVKGTPTIYINGREFDPHQDVGDWIALELQSMGQDSKTAAPAPSASASASALAPAAPPASSSASAKAGGPGK
jgi:protein-disulfide isomerase